MGVTGLSYLLFDASPQAVSRENTLEAYQGKSIAFDASQSLYESVAPKRTRKQMLRGEEKRSPLILTFFSCIRLLEHGIKPLYVFDGPPPKLKSPVIKERREKKEVAKKEFEEAEKKHDTLKMEELRPQTAKVTKKVKKNCKDLLKLLGIPFFSAPGEAEAQCAAFVHSGLVYATATMDLDALTFGTKVVLRNFPFMRTTSKKRPVNEIHLEKVLGSLGLTLNEFIELSIIMGCDYCKGIKGMGAHRAIELIHRYKTIENILESTDMSRFEVPGNWLYKEARNLFLNPKVRKSEEIEPFTWDDIDVAGTIEYLSGEGGYEDKLVRQHLKRLTWNR